MRGYVIETSCRKTHLTVMDKPFEPPEINQSPQSSGIYVIYIPSESSWYFKLLLDKRQYQLVEAASVQDKNWLASNSTFMITGL